MKHLLFGQEIEFYCRKCRKSMISYYENDHGDMKQSMIAEFASKAYRTFSEAFHGGS